MAPSNIQLDMPRLFKFDVHYFEIINGSNPEHISETVAIFQGPRPCAAVIVVSRGVHNFNRASMKIYVCPLRSYMYI